MSRLFEDALTQRSGTAEAAAGGWTPAADIYELEDALVVALELPGVKRDQVDIRFEENVLTVQGERTLPDNVERRAFHRIEGEFGGFSRSFTLPPGIKAEGISASYTDGVLSIRLPQSRGSGSRRIKIR